VLQNRFLDAFAFYVQNNKRAIGESSGEILEVRAGRPVIVRNNEPVTDVALDPVLLRHVLTLLKRVHSMGYI
jgi:hypothetical protein